MTTWRKSSRSGVHGQSDCVEVAQLGGNIGVRDSKHPDVEGLSLDRDQFAALVDSVKRAELDR